MFRRYFKRSPFVVFLIVTSLAVSAGERLVVDFMASSGVQRSAWMQLLTSFKQANPDIEVVNQEFEQEAYKRRFNTRIKTADVDVAFWFAGQPLAQTLRRGLLRPVDDTAVLANITRQFTPATLEAVSQHGSYYGVPLSYYQWGFFYRASLFTQLGIRPPGSWAEFLVVCDKLVRAGITPTAVGAKNGWPAGGWFDYLDLRINGLAFHRALLRGETSFNDPRAVKVFETWSELLKKGYFFNETNDLDWEGVLPYFYRNKVGMVLMGAFGAAKFPESLAEDIEFFPFPYPGINQTVPRYEEAPLDILVFPKTGKNPNATKRFIIFLSQNKALNQFNESINVISPRVDAPPSRNKTLAAGKQLLDGAAGISFFFDRDATPSITDAGFAAFKALLAPPHHVGQAMVPLLPKP